jgi:HPt (histidine-containing phosphotransfer) domain-containing protein
MAAFDRDEFAGSVMGSDELARRIIRAFVNDIPRQLARLAQAVSDGDAPQVMQLAHSIKGAAACVSGQEMREVARQLEQSGREGNLAGAGDGLRQLAASFARAKTAMEGFCEEDAGDS